MAVDQTHSPKVSLFDELEMRLKDQLFLQIWMIKQKKLLEHIINTKCFLSPAKEQRGKRSCSVFAHQEQKSELGRSVLDSPTPINQLLTKTCAGSSTRSTLDCILIVFSNVIVCGQMIETAVCCRSGW